MCHEQSAASGWLIDSSPPCSATNDTHDDAGRRAEVVDRLTDAHRILEHAEHLIEKQLDAPAGVFVEAQRALTAVGQREASDLVETKWSWGGW